MVLDTSAIIAALSKKPGSTRFQNTILDAPSLAVSAVTVLETKIVLQSRHGAAAVDAFAEVLDHGAIAIVPFDAEMAQLAFDAFRRYGKGQGHPAQLNILDCAAYALAKIRGEPLLFKGYDFAATDVQPVI